MTAPRRALLTGATGFVGGHVARHLAAVGWEVHALLRPDSSADRAPVEARTHRHDGTTEALVGIVGEVAPDVVFHLASLFVAEHRTSDVVGLVDSNLMLGTQLAEAMRVHGRTRLVNTGSAWQHYHGEDYNPTSLYAATKQAYLDVLRYYVEAADFSVITLELYETYGPDDPRPKLMGALRRAARDGSRLTLTDGLQRLDYVHVEDVARAYECAGDRLLAGEVRGHERYAVRTGTPVSIRELAELFGRAGGRPLDAVWGARSYRAREVMEPWTGGEALPGWRPRIALEEGIRRLLGAPLEMSERPAGAALVRGIRRWDLVALVVNSVIGAGIFGLPARVFALAGTWSLAAYGVCAVLVVLIVLCFAEVSSRFETTGGPYLYAREAFGPAFGFQVGWLLWLARVTAFAALANLWVDYLGFFWPAAAAWRAPLLAAVTVAFTALNLIGVRSSALVIDVFTVGKLVPLAVFIVGGLLALDRGAFHFRPVPAFGSFSQAVLLLAFAFSGFEMAVIPSGEQTDPRRHAPFALLGGIALVVVVYMLIQVVSIGTLPTLATSERPLADAGTRFLGSGGGVLIAAGALVSVTGTLDSIVLVGPRLLFAMAERGQLPAVFATTHPRFRTPWVAILATSVVEVVLTVQGSFISALTVSTVIRLLAYAATCAAVLALRRRSDAPRAAFAAPAGGVVAVAAIVLCGWLVSSSSLHDLGFTAVCIVAGAVLYRIGGRGRRAARVGEATA